MTGKFFGVGVGPGQSELMTLRAYRVLQAADCICVPKSTQDNDSIALNIVQKELGQDLPVLELLFPMSKSQSVLEEHWESAYAQVEKLLLTGKNVAFITIGDPMFFSTYSYLLTRIKNRLPQVVVETVPGVTAMAASASFLNHPLVEADESLAVIPAAYELDYVKDTLAIHDTVVLMKVNKQLDLLIDLLEELDLLDKAVFISQVGHVEQFYCSDISTLKGKKQHYMSLLIIRKRGWREYL